MTERFDMERYIAQVMGDSERMQHVNEYREEIQAERSLYLEGAMLTIFGNASRASTVTETEREELVNETVSLILDDPELTDMFLDAVDPASREDDYDLGLVEEIRTLMLDAADPHTGELPGDFQLPPNLQAVYDKMPALQDFREELRTLIAGDADFNMQNVAEYMTPVLEKYRKPHQVTGDRFTLINEGVTVEQEQREVVLRSESGTSDVEEREPRPYEVTIQYMEDDMYRLREIRVYQGDGKYSVDLEAYLAGTNEPVAESRKGWRVTAMLEGRELGLVAAGRSLPLAWSLAEHISGDLLGRISYTVEVI